MYSLALSHSIPSWLVRAEIVYTIHVVLHKQFLNQFKPVQQSRQQALKAYCTNIYTVPVSHNLELSKTKLPPYQRPELTFPISFHSPSMITIEEFKAKQLLQGGDKFYVDYLFLGRDLN